MRLVKNSIGKVAVATVLAFTMAGAAAAQNVVVRATGPSATKYKAGTKLSNTTSVKLASGDRVTILGRNGTRVLKGPGTFSLSGREGMRTSSRTKVSSYIKASGSRLRRGGAVRGAGDVPTAGKPEKPNIWMLDLETSGNFCVIGSSLYLWRPDFSGSSSVDIVAPESGTITKVKWEETKDYQAWPDAAPISDGSSYRLIGSGMPQERNVTFKVLESLPIDELALTTALIDNGCNSQVDQLMTVMGAGEEGDGSSS